MTIFKTKHINISAVFIYLLEISNFLSDNETDLIIEMAEKKRMSDLKVATIPVTFSYQINQRTFDGWDVNFDGKISMEEVRLYLSVT